jgi:hypothetical protein
MHVGQPSDLKVRLATQGHLRVPKTYATWAKALQSAVERSACAGPVLARPEVG